MSKSLRAVCMALAVSASLAACSSNDMDRLMGRDDDDNNNNNSSSDNNRVSSTKAVSVCADAVQKRGWTVLDTHETGSSGQNNVEVEMSVRQADGDVRDVTCTYDTGRNDARLES